MGLRALAILIFTWLTVKKWAPAFILRWASFPFVAVLWCFAMAFCWMGEGLHAAVLWLHTTLPEMPMSDKRLAKIERDLERDL